MESVVPSSPCCGTSVARSIGGYRFPNFEMLDAKIASAMKKIITNPYVKKKVSLEEQKGTH